MYSRNKHSYQGLYQLTIAILPFQAIVNRKAQPLSRRKDQTTDLFHTRTTDVSQRFSTSGTVHRLLSYATDPTPSVLKAALVMPCLQDTFQPKVAFCSAKARFYL